jgi:hypothetical protein
MWGASRTYVGCGIVMAMARRKVTLNLDEEWVAEIDRRRGLVPRSRFVEVVSGVAPRDGVYEVAPRQVARSAVVVSGFDPVAEAAVHRQMVEELAEGGAPSPVAGRSPVAPPEKPVERSYSELPMRERLAILAAEESS